MSYRPPRTTIKLEFDVEMDIDRATALMAKYVKSGARVDMEIHEAEDYGTLMPRCLSIHGRLSGPLPASVSQAIDWPEP